MQLQFHLHKFSGNLCNIMKYKTFKYIVFQINIHFCLTLCSKLQCPSMRLSIFLHTISLNSQWHITETLVIANYCNLVLVSRHFGNNWVHILNCFYNCIKTDSSTWHVYYFISKYRLIVRVLNGGFIHKMTSLNGINSPYKEI